MNAVTPVRRADDIAPLRDFVTQLAALVDTARNEHEILASGSGLLARLIARDDWLPEQFAVPSPTRYQQYLLHCDSRERFSVVSFVWGPGQATPVHDHGVWGLVGVLRGVERIQRYARSEQGIIEPVGDPELLAAGKVDAVSPGIGDIHQVANGRDDGPSVSIHVYGANIGAVERATYGADGARRPFISGYANSELPNLWDRSVRP